MDKLGAAFGCLLLLGALSAPVAFAHYDNGADGIFGDADNDSNADAVSGWYNGSANFILNIVPAVDDSACGNIPDADLQALCEDVLSGGDRSISAVNVLCDFEVGFPGPGGSANDEAVIEGAASEFGTLADHFNDGGRGAVCHTPEGHYDAIEGPGYDYDTGGCGYAPAYGEDAVSASLWGSTACDDSGPGSRGSLVDHVLQLAFCNGIRTAAIPVCADNFVECANDVLRDLPGGLGNSPETTTDNLLNPFSGGLDDNLADTGPDTGPYASDCPNGATICGADGSADRSVFGDLSAKSGSGAYIGVYFPLLHLCDAFGAASVFVWNIVVIVWNTVVPPGVQSNVANFGWIN